MRNLRELDRWRVRGQAAIDAYGWEGDETCGAFVLRSNVSNAQLVVVASSEGGWDHVSVSCRNRCPTWAEMEQVKRAFFRDDETAMQLHLPFAEHINIHPNCLHLWAPNDGRDIPLPPRIFV